MRLVEHPPKPPPKPRCDAFYERLEECGVGAFGPGVEEQAGVARFIRGTSVLIVHRVNGHARHWFAAPNCPASILRGLFG